MQLTIGFTLASIDCSLGTTSRSRDILRLDDKIRKTYQLHNPGILSSKSASNKEKRNVGTGGKLIWLTRFQDDEKWLGR